MTVAPEALAGRVAPTPRRRWWKAVVIGLAFGSLLIPTVQSSRALFPGIFCLPLLFLGYRERDDQAFRWWAAYVLGFMLFTVLRVSADDWGGQVHFDYAIILDRWLGFGTLPTHWLQGWYSPSSPGLVDWLLVGVYFSFYYAPPLVALWLWRRDAGRFRHMVAALLLHYIPSYALFLLPTAPPWLAAQAGIVAPVHRVVFELVYPGLVQYGQYVAGGNDVAAMPSVHMSITVILSLALWRYRAFAITMAALMALALVYTGEHYVIDLLVGTAIALVAWWLAGRWLTTDTPTVTTPAQTGMGARTLTSTTGPPAAEGPSETPGATSGGWR